MTLPLSGRALPALAVLLALVVVPTVVHSYRGFEVAAAPIVAADLPAQVNGMPGVDVPRNDAWMRETYGAESWVERRYGTGAEALTLFVVRGHDLKKIYHHPELGVLRGRSFARVQVVELQGEAARPVHVLLNETVGDSAVYALVFDTEWVGNPYWLQIRSAFSSLWAGRRAITLVMVHGGGVVGAGGEPRPEVAEMLVSVAQPIVGTRVVE